MQTKKRYTGKGCSDFCKKSIVWQPSPGYRVHLHISDSDKKTIVKSFDNNIFVFSFGEIIIVMKNIIGSPARGENFYSREREIQRVGFPKVHRFESRARYFTFKPTNYRE